MTILVFEGEGSAINFPLFVEQSTRQNGTTHLFTILAKPGSILFSLVRPCWKSAFLVGYDNKRKTNKCIEGLSDVQCNPP